MTENTHSGKISNLNNFTTNLIKEVRSLDAYLANGIIDAKTYKLRLNGRAKAFLNILKGNSTYSPHYVKVTILRPYLKYESNITAAGTPTPNIQ
ncbi:hypothetical protein [Borrelia sp. RT1S]|uniref:hypothetical protein n=1 Tax=Borrelia sp. RT1S TaxID=2898580 RepID=UPI001E4BE987|nr:hypothetical protein [Borrelia sp. RT1S]UGQ17944.1 hypothetical protein LSO05_05790 [Borrelia sp. RT1S]